jgi:hypothetical protein
MLLLNVVVLCCWRCHPLGGVVRETWGNASETKYWQYNNETIAREV